MPTKEQIIEILISNCDKETQVTMSEEIFHSVNDENWTIADLFIRQWLNNGGNGFGMRDVRNMYMFLCEHKEELIEYELINKDGFNNSGFPLWKNYEFDFDHMKQPEVADILEKRAEAVQSILEGDE
jgi:hypothetical protein